MDPFKVAANGLDAIFESAKANGQSTVVTVLSPIKYELEYPSIHYAAKTSRGQKGNHPRGDSEGDLTDNFGMGGRVVDSLLKSLEDPVLSKWIIVALAMSVVLNGYLFNAARWSIKDPQVADHPVDPIALGKAEQFNAPQTPALQKGEFGESIPTMKAKCLAWGKHLHRVNQRFAAPLSNWRKCYWKREHPSSPIKSLWSCLFRAKSLDMP
jgi:hydroxymethylglutaryl-CoA reductase (NADPH)